MWTKKDALLEVCWGDHHGGLQKQIQGRVEVGGVVLTGLTGTTDQWGTTPEMLRGPGPTEGLSALIWLTV